MQAGRQQTWAGQLERLPHGVLAGRQSPEEGGRGRAAGEAATGRGAGRTEPRGRGFAAARAGTDRRCPRHARPATPGLGRVGGMGEPAPRRALERDLLLREKPSPNPPESTPS